MIDNYLDKIKDNQKFKDFVLPMEKLERIRDATIFIREDGLILFSEGYYHPPGQLIANIVYRPDPAGKKEIFGQPYTSVIKKKQTDGEEGWINYEEQLELYRKLAPASQEDKPLFARYKCRFDLKEMIGFVDHRFSLKQARRLSPEIDDAMKKVAGMLKIPPETIGCTGSMALGNLRTAHDFDLVFYGTVAESRKIVNQIYEITRDPARQVFELGMFWAIRFYDDWGNLICPFFSYLDPAEIPLPEFKLKLIEETAELTGLVVDDTHTFYMPSLLQLNEVRIGDRARSPLTLILYHGALRGEYKRGDRVRARGSLVEVVTPERSFPALLCTNLTETEKIEAGSEV